MQQAFEDHIRANFSSLYKKKTYLAVSGGIDSMAMAHLFHKLELDFELLHCNFQLRADESDQDEIFVREIAERYSVKVHVKRFDTEKEATDKNFSIQMAARSLRYEWFEKIANEENVPYVAIAHNKNDNVETFFINLLRGTGLEGLTGISDVRGIFIRPLLFASREDIQQYVNAFEVSFREDSSNQSDKYSRNYIRHHIIPGFEELNSSFIDKMNENMERLSNTNKLLTQHVDEVKYEVTKEANGIIKININRLNKLSSRLDYLYFLLKPLGFSWDQTERIVTAFSQPGKQFFSASHRLLIDREDLLVKMIDTTEVEGIILESEIKLMLPIKLDVSRHEMINISIDKNPNVAFLDADQAVFPLVLRKWEKGDFFYPLGMNSPKKLSDFFIDKKLSIFDKENTFVLESNNKIIWVVGHRIDNRFKINEQTKKVLKIETF